MTTMPDRSTLRVLLVARPDVYQGSGGDLVQIKKTAEYLEKLGHMVTITHRLRPDFRQHDVAHFFTLATWFQLKRASNYGIPHILSPVYWDPSHAADRARAESPLGLRILRQLVGQPDAVRGLVAHAAADVLRGFSYRSSLKDLAGTVALRTRTRRQGREVVYRDALETAQMLLPNAELEMRHIEERFGVKRPYAVVPNGADPRLFVPTSAASSDARSGVLCVAARVNHRKNQALLISALRGTGIPLTIVGRAYETEERRYLYRCRQLADSTVSFVDHVDSNMLRALYANAKVHALISWFETPGLVSIEAAIAGCRIVATREGTAEEYFGRDARYVPPDDVESVRSTLLAAYTTTWNPRLQDRCRRLYTWDRVARMTGSAYERLLSA